MSRIISINSFSRGVGKSLVAANMAALLALSGRRVALLDTNLYGPSAHLLFNLNMRETPDSLTEYFLGRCPITEAAYEVTPLLKSEGDGKLFVVPAEGVAGTSAQLLRQGYDLWQMGDGIESLLVSLKLDVLFIDSAAGLNEETMISIALADGAIAIVLRPDEQDYQGTGVMVEVASKLDVTRSFLVVNKVPPGYDLAEAKTRIQQTFRAEVAAVLPQSDELASLGNNNLLALKFPGHPITESLLKVALKLTA